MSMSPQERKLLASKAAHTMHAKGGTNTAPGRAAFDRSFEDQVDPDRALSPAERAKRAEHARKAHFAGLALKSAQARRARRSATDDRPAA